MDMAHSPWKTKLVAWVASLAMRVIGRTCRIVFHDKSGIVARPPDHAVIWCLWHNRIFLIPWYHRRIWKTRPASVLTSPSGDGAMIAATCGHFNIGAVRGSSNKNGARALVEMRSELKKGHDVTFTPDGPRGPRYVIAPGVAKLAAITGFPVIPIHVTYEKAWRLKSWDGFFIPRPFSKVEISYDEPVVLANGDEEFLEKERLRLESVMRRGVIGDEAGIGVTKQKKIRS
jgi:lysophospholipid acyltransferase (LPLAT)-like uncharacterized protein